MLVCHCRGVTDRQIRRLVKDGACSTREIARATGAGMRCGGCRSNVTRVVNEAMGHEMQKAGSPIAANANAGSSGLLPLSIPVEG